MRNFQDSFETNKRSFISAFSTFTTVPLIEYKKRNIFLEKSLGLSSKKSKLSIFESLIQFVFIACYVDGYQIILKLSCRPLAFTLHKTF